MASHISDTLAETRQQQARLVPIGNTSLPIVELEHQRMVVGSHADCDLTLAFDGVASRHCTISSQPEGFVVKTHSPMSWLNDRPFDAATLRDGDRLALGPVQFRFVLEARPSCAQGAQPTSRSESVFDDDDESAYDETLKDPVDTNRNPMDADSQILSAEDTVLIDQKCLLNELFDESGKSPASTVETSGDGVSETSPAPSVDAVPNRPAEAVSVCEDVLREQNDLVIERALLQDQRSQLEQRRKLLDDRESELESLFSEVNWRQMKLLQQQQQWELLCEKPAADTRRQSQSTAERLLDAECKLAEQTEVLEALQRELQLRDVASREARQQLHEIEVRMAGERERCEALDRREVILQRGAAELDMLSASLDSERALLRNKKQMLVALEQELAEETQVLAAREAELSARAAVIQQECEESGRRRATLECRTMELSQRDALLSQSEASLVERATSLDGREAALDQREHDLSEREHVLRVREEELRGREASCQEEQNRLSHLSNELGRKEAELAQRATALDAREQETESSVQKGQAEDEQRQAIRLQQETELESERVALEQLRAEDEKDREEIQQRLSAQRDQLATATEQLEADRLEFETEVAEIRERLAKQQSDLDAFELDLVSKREELEQRENAVVEAVGGSKPASEEEASHEQRRLDQLNHELAAWEQRLSFIEQELTERSRQLDEAEQLIEQERNAFQQRLASLENCEAELRRRESTPNQPESRPSSHAPAAARAASSERLSAAIGVVEPDRNVEESSSSTDAEPPEVKTLRNQLAQLFGIDPHVASHHDKSADHHQTTTTNPALSKSSENVELDAEQDRGQQAAEGVSPGTDDNPVASHAHDSVDSYWLKLLARSRGGDAGQAAELHDKPASVSHSASNEQTQSPSAPSATAEVSDAEQTAVVSEPGRRTHILDNDERLALREHMSSLRAVANQSARSAVAKHVSRQMMLQYHVKGLITLICGVVTILLLSSPLWSNLNYVAQGLAALLITGFMGWLLWNDYRKLQAATEAATGSEPEGEPEEVDQEKGSAATAVELSKADDAPAHVEPLPASSTVRDDIVQEDDAPSESTTTQPAAADAADYTPLFSGLFVKKPR